MQNLHHSNKLERIVPEHQFYNKTLSQAINLFSEWDSFKASGKCSQVFNYFSYPFLIGLNVKYAVLQRDFHEQKNMQVGRYLNQFLGTLGSKKVTATSLPALFPRGVKVTPSNLTYLLRMSLSFIFKHLGPSFFLSFCFSLLFF